MSGLLGVPEVHDYVRLDMVPTTNTIKEEQVKIVGNARGP